MRNKASKPVRGRIREQILQLDSGVDLDQVAPFHKIGEYRKLELCTSTYHGNVVYVHVLYYYN